MTWRVVRNFGVLEALQVVLTVGTLWLATMSADHGVPGQPRIAEGDSQTPFASDIGPGSLQSGSDSRILHDLPEGISLEA